MKNSVSDRSFYIESSDDEDFDKEIDDGNESESSGSSADNRNINQPSSYNAAAWPQSYRFAFSSSHLFFLCISDRSICSASLSHFFSSKIIEQT